MSPVTMQTPPPPHFITGYAKGTSYMSPHTFQGITNRIFLPKNNEFPKLQVFSMPTAEPCECACTVGSWLGYEVSGAIFLPTLGILVRQGKPPVRRSGLRCTVGWASEHSQSVLIRNDGEFLSNPYIRGHNQSEHLISPA